MFLNQCCAGWKNRGKRQEQLSALVLRFSMVYSFIPRETRFCLRRLRDCVLLPPLRCLQATGRQSVPVCSVVRGTPSRNALTNRSRASRLHCVLTRQFVVDVRPEFLQQDRERVEADLRPPDFGRVLPGSVGGNKQVRVRRRAQVRAPRMVAVGGDGSGRSAAKNLRVVELRMPRIAASNEDPADRIATSACKPALLDWKNRGSWCRTDGKTADVRKFSMMLSAAVVPYRFA